MRRIIVYLIAVMPCLAFWLTVRFIATGLEHLAVLITARVQAKKTRSLSFDLSESKANIPTDSKRRQRSLEEEDWQEEWLRLHRVAQRASPKLVSSEPTVPSGLVRPLDPVSVLENDARRPDGPCANTFDRGQHEPFIAHEESSNQPSWDGLIGDGELRQTVLATLHTLLKQLHAARLRGSDDMVRVDKTAEGAELEEPTSVAEQDDANHIFAADPRTMWAWSEYLKHGPVQEVSSKDALQILEAIPAGDHVEIFAAVAITREYFLRRPKNAVPQQAKFAAKTFGAWILPALGNRATKVLASDTKWSSSQSGSMVDSIAENNYRMADDWTLIAYTDSSVYKAFSDGVGTAILRLPDNPLTATPPELGASSVRSARDVVQPRRLLGDWRTAEDVARWHMSGPLGFFGSRLTGGVSDRGIDVEHSEAVAQVKMQANPVGSPQVRQLRGARPHLTHHIFYSTSGYTRAAISEAADTGVALFTMDDNANVNPKGLLAQDLILRGHERHGGDAAAIAAYVGDVSARVRKAHDNYGSSDAWWALREADDADWDRLTRAESYLKGALSAVRWHPRIGEEPDKVVVSHFRNADLCAAFFCRVLDLPYPGDKAITQRKPPTAADFY